MWFGGMHYSCWRIYENEKTGMGGAYNKDGRRKDSNKGSKLKLPYHMTSGKTKN
jgi:hypothetical protein